MAEGDSTLDQLVAGFERRLIELNDAGGLPSDLDGSQLGVVAAEWVLAQMNRP